MERRYIPPELLNLVGKYKEYAEMNNKILKYIFDQFLSTAENSYEEIKHIITEIDQIFKKYKVNAHIITVPDLPKNDPGDNLFYSYELIYYEDEDIPDKLLMDLIDYFLNGTYEDMTDRPIFLDGLERSEKGGELNKHLINIDSKIRIIMLGRRKSFQAVLIR